MRLDAPFPPDAIKFRVGSTNQDKTRGLALPYIDARTVMDRLDDAVGRENWQCTYQRFDDIIVCNLGVRVGETCDFVWKADGAGETDFEAEKGGLSDAFKRAAVRFGIGRYLYGGGNEWVEIEPFGRSYRIARAEEQRLRAQLGAGAGTSESGAPGGESGSVSSAPAPPSDAREVVGWNPPGEPAQSSAQPPPKREDDRYTAHFMHPPYDGPVPREPDYVFIAGAPAPDEPSWRTWRDDAVTKNSASKLAGKTWGEILQGTFGGDRYGKMRFLLSFPDMNEKTRERALYCVWHIEQQHWLRQDAVDAHVDEQDQEIPF